MPTSGTLYLVPTPIGNLEDITLRALRVLKEADIILAEDTRTSGVLLNHFEIKSKVYAYHAFNEHQQVESLLRLMREGKSLALISDAGTPGISDPGFLLARACVAEGLPLECLPGATAFVPALLLSGLPADHFEFSGFLPHKKGKQTRLLQMLSAHHTQVCYESPHRLVKTLDAIVQLGGGERKVAVAREITKKFEQCIRGTAAEVLLHFQTHEPKGEIVLILEGKNPKDKTNLVALDEEDTDSE